MVPRTLYYYTKEQYWVFRREKEAEEFVFYSFSEMLNDSVIREMGEYDIIDITSLAPCLKKQDDFLYTIERLFALAGDGATYIVEEKHKEFLMYHMKYVFDEASPVEITKPPESKGIMEEESPDDNAQEIHTVKKVTALSDGELIDFFNEFDAKLYGHSEFKREFRALVESFRVFNEIGEHKILSLFLMGESGIGKTEVARALHKVLKGEKKLAKISFGNYSSKDALNSLIGSPLGYIGSDGGELMKRVCEADTGIILIDEFEKADTPVFNYFLDVLENGKLVNTRAEEYDADGYIIVFTSNITKEQFVKNISPELRSRFDYKGVFDLLTDEDKKKFILFRVNEICDKYAKSTGKKIDKKKRNGLVEIIDYSKYSNMRDLNKKIKDTFVSYTKGNAAKASK